MIFEKIVLVKKLHLFILAKTISLKKIPAERNEKYSQQSSDRNNVQKNNFSSYSNITNGHLAVRSDYNTHVPNFSNLPTKSDNFVNNTRFITTDFKDSIKYYTSLFRFSVGF